MFRKILIGYDEPERGGEAIALAKAPRPAHGTLLLTSVSPHRPDRAARDRARRATAPKRRSRSAPARGAGDDPRVRFRLGAGRALSETAELERADLIVVGASRRSA